MRKGKPPFVPIAVAVILVGVVAYINGGSIAQVAVNPEPVAEENKKAAPVSGDARGTPSKERMLEQVQGLIKPGSKKKINMDEPLIIRKETTQKTMKPAENLPTTQWYGKR